MTSAARWAISDAMKTSDADILLCVDGRALSPGHWVERWSKNLRTGRLVDVGPQSMSGGSNCTQADVVLRFVEECDRPIVLIGYHVGAAAIVEAVPGLDSAEVKGAFIVAPPDVALQASGRTMAGALSNEPLPFPSLMVASRSDPRCSYERASELALAWGSHLVDAGEVGQIDPSSGHGPWPEGLMRLGWFLKRL